MKKLTHKTKLTLLIIIIVVTWYFWPESKPQGPQPTINPTPKYFVTISGNIDPKMKKPIYMGFWVSYGGYNKECSSIPNKWSGISYMPGKVDFYSAKPNKKGDYTVKIPIDRYKKGKCDWKIAYIDTGDAYRRINKNRASAKEISTLMQFGNRKNENANPGQPTKYSNVTAYNCSRDLRWCDGDRLSAGYTDNVPRHKNYHFEQSYKD